MKRSLILMVLTCLLLSGCAKPKNEPTVTREASENATVITLSDTAVQVNGKTAPTTAAAVYTAHDIVYYEDGKDFTYGEGEKEDAHTAEEANAHTVVHITEAGEYVLSGKLSAGQIAVDLGKDADQDPNAVVTLFLNGVDITCIVAPAVIFYNVYECDTADEAVMDVDTSAAGANVVLMDDSTNRLNGSYVAKIYKSVELSDDGTEVVDSKKLHKYDGALYSKMSMNVYGGPKGNGSVAIVAENEGWGSERHLTLYSGHINIESGNDGVNANEDGVSVIAIKGGQLDIVVNGKTGEGDGIDSNGWLVFDGGAVTAAACGSSADAGIDADNGVYLRGGKVRATGNMYDPIAEGDCFAVFTFSKRQSGGDTYTCLSKDGETALTYTPANDFQYLIIADPMLTEGEYILKCGDTVLSVSASQAGGGMRPEGMTPPNGDFQKPDANGEPPALPDGEQPMHPDGERPDMPQGEQPPMNGERPERPNGFDGEQSTEASETFTIQKGANTFRVTA